MIFGELARSKQNNRKSSFNIYYQFHIEEVVLNAVNEINHGVSIKLSALHPSAFETLKYKYVKAELFESVSALPPVQSQNVEITIDAEEQHQLSISLDL